MLSVTLFGQTLVRGTVKDQRGEGIPGANIFIRDSYDGGSSDANGAFSFETTLSGSQVLVASFVGYGTSQQAIELGGGQMEVNLVLDELVSELDAVTITAGFFGASDESRRTIFRAVDIASTAGATADIAGALNTLPGTQKVGETGRLFVRGGDGSETRTFIDGMVVLNAYGAAAPNTPSRGRFLPFMFKGTSFSTGGYSAEYGQALSSALVLESKDKGDINRTDIGLLSVGADLSHAHVWERSSVAAKLQYTNIRPYFGLISQVIDWHTAPVSWEGSGAYRKEVGKHGMLKAYANFNHSTLSLYRHAIDNPASKTLYDLTNNYQYANLSYKDQLNDGWMIRTGISYNRYRDDTRLDSDRRLEETESGLHVKSVAEGSVSDQITVRVGAEVIGRRYRYTTSEAGDAGTALQFDEWLPVMFAEMDLYTSNRFVTRAGVRAEVNTLNDVVGVDPRLSLAYKAGDHGQFSLAYGKFRQSPVNQVLRNKTQLKSEKADHYILNYQVVKDNKTFRAELYYKDYRDLVKWQTETTLATNDGSGYAKGFELFWRDNETFRNTDYWISYSYLDTERNYRDYPGSATPSFASAHNFSIVYKYFITRLRTQAGATYSFASGRPYHNPNEPGFNNSATRSYHDLSVNFAYLPKPNLIIYLSCTNVLGYRNVFGYEYADQPDSEGVYAGRPVTQPAKRFVFVGIFITLSKDKTTNQLPSL